MKHILLFVLKIITLIAMYLVIATLTLVVLSYLYQFIEKNVVPCPYTSTNTSSDLNKMFFDINPSSMFSCYSVLGITITPDSSGIIAIIGGVLSLLVAPGIVIYFAAKRFFKNSK